ncbi:hypothetical protein Pmani_038056 [Petrolisthes manimaculis]|uniref:Uncharacterized protein n=1 Tax=Petrolisthes manimaculis TaxID=1843537 RepID=A0AAE1TKL2_9EUCA|nr:hypothetical protein Pmani_038056 [Petrolisthes manimaculis]
MRHRGEGTNDEGVEEGVAMWTGKGRREEKTKGEEDSHVPSRSGGWRGEGMKAEEGAIEGAGGKRGGNR